KHNLVRRSAHLPASHGVPELMQQHDQEQRQILHHIPDERAIPALPALDLNRRHDKPGPMQKQIDTGEAKQMDRPLANIGHIRSLIHSDYPWRSAGSPHPSETAISTTSSTPSAAAATGQDGTPGCFE